MCKVKSTAVTAAVKALTLKIEASPANSENDVGNLSRRAQTKGYNSTKNLLASRPLVEDLSLKRRAAHMGG